MIVKQLQDIRQVEPNIILNCDCLEGMKFIADKSIDMILCDLPYGTTACKWDTIIPFDKLWEQYKRIIKDNGAIVLTASQPFTSALVMSNIKLFKYQWIWEKNKGANFMSIKYQPIKFHEDILVFSKGGCNTNTKTPIKYNPQGVIWQNKIKYRKEDMKKEGINKYNSFKEGDYESKGQNYPKSIIKFNSDKGLHPTQKPVKLFEYLIKTYTNEGETILDNCAGSFTTAIACDNLKRKWICMEQDTKYCEIGLKRILENPNFVI